MRAASVRPSRAFAGSVSEEPEKRQMTDFVLTVWADHDDAGSDPPMSLRIVDEATPIATHDTGFDTSPFVVDGEALNLNSCLTAEGLLNGVRNKCVGTTLWERLTPGDIGTQLRKIRASSRIYLNLQSPGLLAYPWELLRTSDWSLFTEAHMCIGDPRPFQEGFAGVPPTMDHPLRIMVVMGEDPEIETSNKIQADEELIAIEAAAQNRNDEVLLKTLIRPAPGEIQEALQAFEPHIFHFIGHGALSAADDTPEIYVYSATSRQNDPWGADRIRGVFRQSPPRLVVLNACLTGTAPTASTSLVKAFLDAGCMAVIAMMGEIRGDASLVFSQEFYTQLIEHGKNGKVDAAVAAARRYVRDLATGSGDQANVPALKSNWPLPRLTVRGDVEKTITMTKAASRGARRWLREDFVGRWDERWRVWQLLDGKVSRLALVSGQASAGKTELLNTIAATYARQGETVIMVTVGGKTTGNSWRDLLQMIADSAEAEGLPAERLQAAATAPGKSDKVIKNFQLELAASVGTCRNLLIVLDGLSDWEPNLVRTILLPKLCGPYLLPSPPNAAEPGQAGGGDIRMLLAVREGWSDEWQARPTGWQPIELGDFLEEWDRAITHFEAHWIKGLKIERQLGFRTLVNDFRTHGPKNAETLRLIRGVADNMGRS
jgi:hypothetical protein